MPQIRSLKDTIKASSIHIRMTLVVVLMTIAPIKSCYLNACYPVGRTLWEGLDSLALMEEVCHLEWTWSFLNLTASPVIDLSFCLLLVLHQLLFHYHGYLLPGMLPTGIVMD